MEIDIEIDSLTDCLIDRSTGEKFDTVYRLISKNNHQRRRAKTDESGMEIWLERSAF